eukprot:CAMPEP_0118644820 /NCGR_PEP_ID=MMETSP0785-20121206/7156_1 /TAXON_ID=91992 /ORGANISM="Bolidomonas pacifica, Strain CCMP 1866" /LENGTH=713 /DNA_ID=CAMNT_0006536631 /DNA_START=111 /DNA_END=2252 /DNA_ORIENTATION=+
MRVAPRAGHPRVAATSSGNAGRKVEDGVIYYKDDDGEGDDPSSKYALMDKTKERKADKESRQMEREIRARQKHSRNAKKAWRENSRSPERGGDDSPSRRGGTSEWDEDFGELAASVRNSKDQTKAAPRWASSRPKTSKGISKGEISSKVEKLEDTVVTLSEELEEAKKLLQETNRRQQVNNDETVIDTQLAEKLALLKRDQERNVKVIEQLVRQRDNAQAKARRLEEVLVKEVESLDIDTSVELKRPTPASTSPKKSHSQRPGESDEEYKRRIKHRHRNLVRPFRSMEVHEAVRRRNKMKEEEEMSRKKDIVEALERQKRDRMQWQLEHAREFSFAKEDRKRQEKKRAELEKKRADRKAEEDALQFKARPVKLYHTENWEDIAKRQDAERKQRVAARAAQIQSTSQLPARMAMHEALKKQEGHVVKESASERTKKKLAAQEEQKKIKPTVDPENYTQIMKSKQAKWEEKLRANKEAVRAHATVPNRELPIERRQREYEEKRRARIAREQRREAAKKNEILELERIAKERALAAFVVQPKSTKAQEQRIKKLEEDKQKKIEEKAKNDKKLARQKAKQKRIDAEVIRMVSEMEKERKAAFPGNYVALSNAGEKALAAKKAKEEEFRKRQKALKDRLKDVQKKHKEEGGIIGATEKAIMKQRAKRKALSVVADAVGWRDRGIEDDLFDDAEKAYLGFAVGGANVAEGGEDDFGFGI